MERSSLTRKLTVREFFKRFPDEATCLEHVMDVRFGLRHTCAKCGVVGATFHRLENRKAYACAHCGDNLYPCAGTIFQDSRTPLQVWFYAIYLFTVSRNGVSGMELHRTLGVTRKTGYRIGQQIRQLMDKANDQANTTLSGHVESDETFVGGAVRGQGRGPYAGGNKTVVLGMKERGGRIVTKVIPDVTTATLKAEFAKHVAPGSFVSTDEAKGYNLVKGDGYTHLRVNHSEEDYAHYDCLSQRGKPLKELTGIFQPAGKDAEIIPGRKDTYFSQKVRNLISHREGEDSFIANGFADYYSDGPREGGIIITDAGRKLVKSLGG